MGLILNRKEGEEIVVGKEEMTIKVLSINGRYVRLYIEAPKKMTVHRREIYERILKEEQGIKEIKKEKLRVHYVNGNRIDKR